MIDWQLSSIGMENILTGMNLTFDFYQGHMIKNFFSWTSFSSDYLRIKFSSANLVRYFFITKSIQINLTIID